jgi:hypothetical protein
VPDGQYFAELHADALMGSMLGLTGELLLLAARQRRLAAAHGSSAEPDLDGPLDAAERAWVADRADVLVGTWLGPFRRAGEGAADAA